MTIKFKNLTLILILLFTTEKVVADDVTTKSYLDSVWLPRDTVYADNSVKTYSAQEIEMPQITSKSPEASAFQKYGETEANEYTGNPAISIPLYTLSYKGIEMPIALTYDGGGIKVAQEASWVGLGWNLNIGGCINYVVQGGNDQWLGRHGNWEKDYYRVLNSDPADHFKLKSNFCDVPFLGNESENIHEMLQDLKNGQSEWDYYSVNILGRFFLFMKNPYTDKYEIIGDFNETFNIKTLPNNNWEITDINGVIYTFTEKEYSKEQSWGSFVSAWNLTKITNPSGGIIRFEYSDLYSYRTLPNFTQYYNYITDYRIMAASTTVAYPSESGSYAFISNGVWKVEKKYLSSITTDDNSVKISLSISDRDDLQQAQKLNYISITSPLSNKRIKAYKFKYSYFLSCTKGGNYLANPQQKSYNREDIAKWSSQEKYRLKLMAISELDDSDTPLTTSFEYYGAEYGIDSLLPAKSSCAIDFWGYYNGEENLNPYYGYVNNNGYTHGLLPKPTDCYFGNIEKMDAAIPNIDGVNRLAKEKFTKIGTLHKITYPTKGYTIYNFEPHNFYTSMRLPIVSSASKRNGYTVQDFNFVTDANHLGPVPQQLANFTIAEDSWGELELRMQGRSEADLRKMASTGACVRIVRSSPKPTTITYYLRNYYKDYSKLSSQTTVYKIDLPAGNYTLEADLPDILGKWDYKPCPNYICGSLSFFPKEGSVIEDTIIKTTTVGGGLRIKDITNYQADGTLANRTEYDYTVDGVTSGIALIPPLAIRERSFYWSGANSLSSYKELRFCSNLLGNSAYTAATSKGTIGYSSVRKNIYDKNNKLINYTISKYRNVAAKAIFKDYYQFAEYENGNLLARKIYDATGKLCKSITNTYERGFNGIVKCNSYIENILNGDIEGYRQGLYKTNTGIEKLYQLTVYAYFSHWNHLSESIETTYEANGKIEYVSSYGYNPKNHLVSSIETSNTADSVKYKTIFQYPCDIDDEMSKMMSDRYYISPVLKQSNYTNNVLTATKLVNYTALDSSQQMLILPSSEEYALGTATPETRLWYQYNYQGNITGTIKDKLSKTTYLWSYNGAYPIMEIQGASYIEISNWLGNDYVQTLYKKSAPTISDIVEIKSKLAMQRVICKGYLYSPGIGVKLIIAPNGEVTTFDYDNFNRLTSIKDNYGHTIQTYNYNYKK